MAGPSISSSVLFKTALQGAAIKELLNGIKSIITTTAEFAEQQAKVQAVLQVTSGEMVKLSKRARELGADTVFTATEASEGMEKLARLGFDTQEIFVSVQDTLNLAAASAVGLGRASDITAGTLNAFGLEASGATRIVDNLAVVSANSGANVDSLGESIQEGGSIARTAGVSVEEFIAFVGVLGDSMIRGTKAGVGWRQFIVSLLNPTKRSQKALKTLELTQQDVNVSARGLSPVLQTLREAFNNLGSDSERAAVGAQLFGQRSFNASLVAIQAADGVDVLIQKMREGEGTAKRMADVMTDNVAGSFRFLKSASQEMALVIGDELTPNLRRLLDNLTETARGSAEAGSSLENIGKVLGTLLTSFGIIIKGVELVGNLLLAGFAKIVKVVGDGVAQLNRVLAIGFRSTGFDELARDLELNADVIESAMGDFFKRFQPNIDRVGELANEIGEEWDFLRERWKRGAEQIATVDLNPISDSIAGALDGIRRVMASGGEDLSAQVEALREILNLKKLFADVDPSNLTDEQKDRLEVSLGQLVKLFESTGTDLDSSIIEFRDSLSGVGKGVDRAVSDVDEGTDRLSGSLSGLGSVITSSGDIIKASASKISDAISNILGFDKEEILGKAAALEEALLRIAKSGENLDFNARDRVREQVEEIIEEFRKIEENVPPIIEAVARSFGLFPTTFQEVGSSARGMADDVTGSSREIDEAAKSVSDAINKMGGDFSLAGNRTEEGMRRSTKVVREFDKETGRVVTSVVANNATIVESVGVLGDKYGEVGEKSKEFGEGQERVADSTSKAGEQIEGVSTAAESAGVNLQNAATATNTMATAGIALETSLGNSEGIIERLSAGVGTLAENLSKLAGIVVKPEVDLSGIQELLDLIVEVLDKLSELEARA